MVMAIVMFLIGIGLHIVNANGILIVDLWIMRSVFGVAGLLLGVSIINMIRASLMVGGAKRRMRR